MRLLRAVAPADPAAQRLLLFRVLLLALAFSVTWYVLLILLPVSRWSSQLGLAQNVAIVIAEILIVVFLVERTYRLEQELTRQRLSASALKALRHPLDNLSTLSIKALICCQPVPRPKDFSFSISSLGEPGRTCEINQLDLGAVLPPENMLWVDALSNEAHSFERSAGRIATKYLPYLDDLFSADLEAVLQSRLFQAWRDRASTRSPDVGPEFFTLLAEVLRRYDVLTKGAQMEDVVRQAWIQDQGCWGRDRGEE